MNAQYSANVSVTLKRSGMSCSLGLVTRFKCMKHCVSGLKSPVSWTVHRAKVAKKCLERKRARGYTWEFLVGCAARFSKS